MTITHNSTMRAAFLATAFLGLAANVRAGTSIIAVDGDNAPSGGTFAGMNNPVLNASGQVAFFSSFSNDPQDQGIFLNSNGTNVQLVRTGQTAPDTNGTYSSLGVPALNDSGQVLFAAYLTNTAGSENQGIFRVTDDEVVQIARAGQSTPDTNGTYQNFGSQFAIAPGSPNLSATGQAAFHATTSTAIFGAPTGIFLSAGEEVVSIARSGEAAPGGGTYSSFMSYPFMAFHPAVNQSGRVLFEAQLDSAAGLFLGSSNGVVEIARNFGAAPGGGFFTQIVPGAALNDSNQVAFVASIFDLIGGESGWRIFRRSETGTVEIVRQDQAAPEGNGTFDSFESLVALNDTGQVAFRARLTSTTGGTNDDFGIYLGDTNGVVKIVREAQSAPNGNGTFSGQEGLGQVALNNSGQVVFQALLTGINGGTNTASALFLADGTNLVEIARTGDSLAGGTIASLQVRPSVASDGKERSGLNDAGQVAYSAILSDGRHAIALFTPETGTPQPASIGNVEIIGNDVRITWEAGGGTTNVVQAAPNLTGFQDISGTIAIPGSGIVVTNFTELNGGTNTQRFYRIRQFQ